ncbi:unnamed protein product, partial [Heterobilharzia americana]
RARVSPSHLPKTIPISPIGSTPVSLSSVLSKSSNYSPSLATSASILTAAALKSGGRRYTPTGQFSSKYINHPSYILVSNQNLKFNHIQSSRSESAYSPSYSSNTGGIRTVPIGRISAETKPDNVSSIYSPLQ